MKILKGHVRWGEGDHRPSVFLLVDDVPNVGLRYVERGGNYYAERDGFCSIFRCAVPGAADPLELINMADGSQRAVRRHDVSASRLNELGFGPCVEVHYTLSERTYAEGYTFWFGAVLVSVLREYASVIDVGQGYTWRPGSRYAAEVVFPRGSQFALACTGTATLYRRDHRDHRFMSRPELFPDGTRVHDVRAAVQAALDANEHDTANEIARRYTRHLPGGDVDALLALSGYEAAVKLPDGSFWTKPA
jgi:hypothetical protein